MSSLTDTWINNFLLEAAGLASQDLPKNTLYVVGLPIGNLADITLRALWVLAHVDIVAAEDTRETHKLLDKFGLSVKLMSVREHNERESAQDVIKALSEGKRVALVTDAGTPAVSDPGARAVRSVREAGFRVIPVPGASAVITALSAAGLEPSGFSFIGFLPPQPKARRRELSSWASRDEPFVLYEAPHRIKALLNDLAKSISGARTVVIAREITKKFETFTALTGSTLAQWADEHEPRGEYVVLVDVAPVHEKTMLSESEKQWLDALSSELPASKLAAIGARVSGHPRDEVYRYLLSKNNA